MENENILGYIYLNRYSTNTWEVLSVAAEHGYGHVMHDVSMNILYPSFIVPSRNKQIKDDLVKTYYYYINNRDDVYTERIRKNSIDYVKIHRIHNDWFNRRYRLDEKNDILLEKSNIKIKFIGIKYFNSKYVY